MYIAPVLQQSPDGRAEQRVRPRKAVLVSLELEVPSFDLEPATIQARFDSLQSKLIPLWQLIESLEDVGEQTIVVVPSLTVDFAALQGSVLQAYEERFLFLLLLFF